MKIPSCHNPYALLALFLSPWKDAETIQTLAKSIDQSEADWRSLLYMANLHFSSPLWFARLSEDRLLPLLPSDLQDYLRHLHQESIARNAAFRNATKEILSELQNQGISAILLKGAATFVDDLYRDQGARMMGDIDVLVKPHHAERVRDLLVQLGYDEQPDCFGDSVGFAGAYRPHHMPRLVKPETPVAVEVHFDTAMGQAGRILQTELSWKHCVVETWEGLNPAVLSPTYRLLHNTVHALVPFKHFVNANISLAHLAEFTHLVLRYGSAVDWREWLEKGARQGLGKQLRVYVTLANRLMGMPFPPEVPGMPWKEMHVTRISIVGNDLAGCPNRSESVTGRIKGLAARVLIMAYRDLNSPAWEWHNQFYKDGIRHIPVRIACLFAFWIHNYLKVNLNLRVLYRRMTKVFSLLNKPGGRCLGHGRGQ